jgi:heme exporter protein A
MRLDALTYRYPGPHSFCLGPLNVEGPDDRPWIVLGASGSGKSTLLRLLGGSLSAASGRVWDGASKERAAYLPQLPERALAGRNLAEDLCGDARPPCSRRSELRAALHAVGLEGVGLARPSRTLSAGERRRAALALLLLSGHDHWALDEPDAALDADGVARVVALLRVRVDSGRGRLWIATHRHEVFAPLRPWVLVLDRGRMLATGEIGKVLREPEVARLVGLPHRPALRLWNALRGGSGTDWAGLDAPSPGGSKPAQLHALLATEAGLG